MEIRTDEDEKGQKNEDENGKDMSAMVDEK